MRNVVIGAGWLWLIVATLAPDSESVLMTLFLFGTGIAIAWFVYPFTARGGLDSWWRALSWLSVPMVPALALLLSWSGWTLTAKIWLCESVLKAHAERVLSEPEPDHPLNQPERRVGLFYVRMSTKWDGNVQMQVWGIKGHDGGGIIYAPNGLPADSRAEHLYGPWYEWGSHFR